MVITMKTIYLIPITAFIFSCSNSKKTQENTISVTQEKEATTPAQPIAQYLEEPEDSLKDPQINTVFIDSSLLGTWPIVTPWPNPGEIIIGNPWPYPFEIIDWGLTSSFYWISPDTIDDYKELPIQHMASNKNCYSFETNETGLLFSMDVIETESLECRLSQFGDCFSHLPLNVSWINAPLLMNVGSKDIQFNYPKYYELELLFKLKSEYNTQEIRLFS